MVELAVALAIMAILASLAAPSFQNLVRDSRLSSQVNELLGAMSTAKFQAIDRRATVQFCTTTSKWEVLVKDGAVLKTGLVSEGVTVEDYCVDFRADGMAYHPTSGSLLTSSNSDSTQTILLDSKSKKIVVNVGAIYVEDQ